MSAEAILVRARLPRRSFTLDVDLQLPPRGITAIFGASGSGKTTLLRCVAGLEPASQGRVVVDGQAWQDAGANVFLPTWQRPLGYVFQEASLFDHLDVRGNVAFAQKRAQGPGRFDLDSVIDLLGIGSLLRRRPHQLSGGERQRVAIARALASQPRILLLDEPLAAVDIARRQEILPWLERLRDELQLPMLYVTHAAEEVARLASHLVLLEAGRCVAAGPLAETLSRMDLPVIPGEDPGVLLEGSIAERDERWHLARVAFPGGALWLSDAGLPQGRPVRVRLLARDISIALQPAQASSIQNVLPCTVRAIGECRDPAQVLVQLACGPSLLLARITARAAHSLQLAPGQEVWAQVKSAALVA